MILLDGVINLLKPPGMTSHDVVAFLRSQFKTKKIGHAGTLDPQAAGVLLLCVGQATRLLEYLTTHNKEYLCEMTLGIVTTTQDAWGEIIRHHPYDDYLKVTMAEIRQVLPRFIGEISQVVPAYSAVKVKGVPLYKRARKGMEIQSPTRQVLIDKIEIIKYEPPRLTFRIKCSKGTYVRTICHDLGEALGVGGHMSFLLRTRVGNFTLEDSKTLEEIVALKEKALCSPESCVAGLPQMVLTEKEIEKIRQGQLLILEQGKNLCAAFPDELFAAFPADSSTDSSTDSSADFSADSLADSCVDSIVDLSTRIAKENGRQNSSVEAFPENQPSLLLQFPKAILVSEAMAIFDVHGKLQAIVAVFIRRKSNNENNGNYGSNENNEVIIKPKKVFNRE